MNTINDITSLTPIPKLPPASERKRLRLVFGVHQTELANVIGVSRQTIRAWETEGGGEPTGHNRNTYAMIIQQWQTNEKAVS